MRFDTEVRSASFLVLRGVFIVVSLVTALAAHGGQAGARNPITAAEAKEHIGENATVCGTVSSTHYAERTRGNPTFINLDKPYPNQIFTIVIWGSDRANFGNPEDLYRSKRICVTGMIKEYRGEPEITLHSRDQIQSER